jgi:hypothetical protein
MCAENPTQISNLSVRLMRKFPRICGFIPHILLHDAAAK